MVVATRWNPFREIAAMQSTLDRLFDESWSTVWPTAAGNTMPVDLYETDKSYIATVAIPGVHQDQISIRFENGVLTISAEVPQPEMKDARLLLQERGIGRYTRSIRLAQIVDVDQAEAHYENGLLVLNLPKKPEAQPKRISISTNGQKQLQSSSN